MTGAEFTVFIVDDDPGVLKALSRLVRILGYPVQAFTSAEEFLGGHDATAPGCAILDLSMPGLDGLQLQQTMMANGSDRPIIFVTGEGDIPTSVRAMKAGAIDFLTKPVNDTDLGAAIARAQKQDAAFRKTQSEVELIKGRISSLTPREREVLTHVVAGRLNKQIAYDLGTVEKTIKVHRGRMMEKLGVRTVADLIRMVQRVGIAK